MHVQAHARKRGGEGAESCRGRGEGGLNTRLLARRYSLGERHGPGERESNMRDFSRAISCWEERKDRTESELNTRACLPGQFRDLYSDVCHEHGNLQSTESICYAGMNSCVDSVCSHTPRQIHCSGWPAVVFGILSR